MAGKGWSIITETSSTGLNKSTRKPLHELQHVSSCKQEQIYVSVMNCDIFMGMNVHCWCVYIWYFNTEIDLLFICCPKPKSSRNVHFEPELCWTAKCFSKYSAEEGAKCHRGTSCALVQLPTVKGFHHFTGSLLLRLAACHCCDNGGWKGEWKKAGCNIWPVEGLMSAIHICSFSSNSSLFLVNRANILSCTMAEQIKRIAPARLYKYTPHR